MIAQLDIATKKASETGGLSLWYRAGETARAPLTSLIFLLAKVACLPNAEAQAAKSEKTEQWQRGCSVWHSAACGRATGVALIARRCATGLILRRRCANVPGRAGLILV